MATDAVPGLGSQAVLRVLLLEDSPFDAELLRLKLQASYPNAGLQVVDDEAAFVAALGRGDIDLVLSDFEVPGFAGLHALAHARAIAPEVPFIFVSGVIGEDNAVEMLKRGATDFVSKGRMERLPVVVDRALRESAVLQGRRRAERQLREADELYARVVDSLTDHAVVLLDAQGRVRGWNRGAEALFGHRRPDMLGRPFEGLMPEDERTSGALAEDLRRARAEGGLPQARWLLRADGTRMRAEGSLVPLTDDHDSPAGFCVVLRDVTDAHEQAARLQAAKDEAERANASKDRFLAMLSHELRTPLSPIASAVYLLEKNASVPEAYRQLLPMIRRNVALESRLIDDLLDLTAISAGKLVLKREPLDLHELVPAVCDILREDAERRRVTFDIRLDAPSSRLVGDAARLQQVLWNLLRNAIKFSHDGGRVALRTRVAAGWLVVECQDHGIGIPAQALPHIFSPFRQASGDVVQQFGGLGLGLAIARGIVLDHGGTIEAESAGHDQGATLRIRLPLAEAAPGRPADPAPPATDDGTPMLLVEDNADAAETMQLALEFFGYRVTVAGSLRQARDALAARSFDVVVTDLGLPDGSGTALGREFSRQVPVIALSGYGSERDVAATRSLGFAGHLVKPVAPEGVHALVQSVLAAQRASTS